MFNTVLSPARRRQLGVCGALLAVSAFTACDKTDPTAPLMKAPGTSSKLAGPTIPQTVISIKIIDEKNNLVKYPGAYFEVFGPLGIHKFVDDGGADDADQAFGSVKIVGLANGSYKVCEIMVAQYFSFPPDSNCNSGNLAPGGQLNMTFFNPRPPALQWGVTNDVGVLLGGGASFLVKDSLGTSWTVTDDQPADAMPWPGSLETFATHPGTWTICETAAPSGYVKPVGQPCFNIVVTWGSIGFAGNFANNLPYALNWGVTEGVLDANNNYVPLAGATFTVAYGRGLSKTTVTDNGPGDYDPRPGRVALKVGGSGSYTVCEVTAPANHWLPKPPCQTTSVSYNSPAFVGWFITPESQVIYIP